MYLRRNIKVSHWNRNCLYAIVILTAQLAGQAVCSDSNSNYKGEHYAGSQRKIPSSGSGSGTLEKRSSYAVMNALMSETINSEFGSE